MMDELWTQIESYEDPTPTDWGKRPQAVILPSDVGASSLIGNEGVAAADHSHKGVFAIRVSSTNLFGDVLFEGDSNISITSVESTRTVTVALSDDIVVDSITADAGVFGDVQITGILRVNEIRPDTDSPSEEIAIIGDVTIDGILRVDEIRAASESPSGVILATGSLEVNGTITSLTGLVSSGIEENTQGVFYAFGSSNTSGGEYRIFIGANHDSVIDYFSISSNEDDLRFRKEGPGVIGGDEPLFSYLAQQDTVAFFKDVVLASDLLVGGVLRVDEIRAASDSPSGDVAVAADLFVDGDVTIDSATASRITATDGSKVLTSVSNLTAWIAGTANQITSTDDGDGTLTIALTSPLTTPGGVTVSGSLSVTDDIYVSNGNDVGMTGNDAKFRFYAAGYIELLNGSLRLIPLTASRLVQTDADKALSSVSNLTSWIAGTASEVTVTDDGDGTVTIGLPDDVVISGDLTVVGDISIGGAMFFDDLYVNGVLYADEIRPDSYSPEGDILLTGDVIASNDVNINNVLYVDEVRGLSGSPSGVTVVDILRAGDITNGYSEFESDGTLRFNGDATVWKDINLASAVLPSPSSAPDTRTFRTSGGIASSVYTYAFDNNEFVHGAFEMQHDYKEGTDITFHVHWQGAGVPTGTDYVRWRLDYAIMRDNNAPGTFATIYVESAYDTAYEFVRSSFAAIAGATSGVGGGEIKIGDQFVFMFGRVASVGDDYADDALTATIGIHHQVDTVGSRTIGAK
jgi:hypothetical protein